MIAQSFGVNYPQKVERLVISDSFGELNTFPEKLLGFSAILGFHLFRIFGKKALVKGMNATYQTPYAKVAQAYFAQVSQTLDLQQVILARKAINQVAVLEQLSTVSLPVLVLVGEDFGQTFIDINRKIADALPQAEFVILDQAMDPSNLVNPTAFNQQVLRFLAQVVQPA
ncbi:MAG: hypothetical protein F6K42_32695 [Leptolyngbya sp. SIO1D8]|nr:hypothetical protein [Leptolyngbya sp. SIO1D8]